MCGIAGLLGRVEGPNRDALNRMANAMRHRGPDGQGTWISRPDSRGHGCLLAHRRLAILDLSSVADQPMLDPETGDALVFNGEIYNFRALRDRLDPRGHSFRSTGDTEVLLRALTAWGPAAVDHLRGMFAFAHWDHSARTLTLARDPLGIKPLYLAANPDTSPDASWTLAFASELRALLASGLLGRPRLDPDAVASVVWNGFVPGPTTIVRGIQSLSPAEVRTLDTRGRIRSSEISWSIPSTDQRSNEDSNPLAHDVGLRDALAESVRLHLISDVPLGVFLSGGIDSGAIANLARRSSPGPLYTFTLAFEDPTLNEGPAAREIAHALGSEHQEVTLTEGRFLDDLPNALATLDQPTFDGLNTYVMARSVREAGLTVALVGTGGDELFGGYRSFRDLPPLRHWARRTRWLPGPVKARAARAATALLQPRSAAALRPQTRWSKLDAMVSAGDDLLHLYQLAYALFLPETQKDLLLSPPDSPSLIAGLPRPLAARLAVEAEGRSPLEAIAVLEQRCFLGERLLRDSDVAGMAASIEMRLPLVDRVLLEQVYRIPTQTRFQPIGTKSALRRAALDDLDPALFDRPKSGFVLPFDTWIRRGLSQSVGDLLQDNSACAAVGLHGPTVAKLWNAYQCGAPGLYWSRVWALYILIHWCHTHGVLL